MKTLIVMAALFFMSDPGREIYRPLVPPLPPIVCSYCREYPAETGRGGHGDLCDGCFMHKVPPPDPRID